MKSNKVNAVFVFYKPRMWRMAWRWPLLIPLWLAWVLAVNVISLTYGLIKLIGMVLLWLLWTLPRHAVKTMRDRHHIASVRKARQELKYRP